jgi:hypothetical protein
VIKEMRTSTRRDVKARGEGAADRCAHDEEQEFDAVSPPPL